MADARGCVVFRKTLRRAKVLNFLRDQPRCLVAMEACGGAHHWAREFARLWHDVRLIPPAYVKPFVKRQKNDASVLSYRLQADAAGDLAADTMHLLKHIGGNRQVYAVQLTSEFAKRRDNLRSGTILVREWNGQPQRVMVLGDGFAFHGKSYDSLSAIAFASHRDQMEQPPVFRASCPRRTVLRPPKPHEATRPLDRYRPARSIAFTRGPLGHMLRNRFYIGKVHFKGDIFPGEQPAIL